MWLVKYMSFKPLFCIVHGKEFVWSKYDNAGKVFQKWFVPEKHRHKTIDQLKQLYTEKEKTSVNKKENR